MLEKLKAVLGKVLPDLDLSTVTEDTRLIEDLGFDSLALMMLAMVITSGWFSQEKKRETC